MSEASKTQGENTDQILWLLSAAAFFIFFNGYMVAPLIPALAREFQTTNERIGSVVPAYLLTYGFSTLFYGPLSDRLGRRKVLLFLLAGSVITTAAVAFAWSVESLLILRAVCGLFAGGIVPISLALVGDLYPYQKLGRALGWIFGAIAGGMSFGSTFGAWLNPSLGWRNEFLFLAGGNAIIFALAFGWRHRISDKVATAMSLLQTLAGYLSLVSNFRGARTFSFIFLNGVFHSGVFSWLGLYLSQRYSLGDVGIGEALLGYGLPGMFLGPAIGRMADRYGRNRILPLGFSLAAICAYLLIPTTSLWIAAVVITLLSVGFDMTHPLMAGIVTALDPRNRGRAMGLNAFALFVGLGFGALVFQLILEFGFGFALGLFATAQLTLAVTGAYLFRHEGAHKAKA